MNFQGVPRPNSLYRTFQVLKNTHTQPFNGLWSRTTRVGRYQKKYPPTHTHPDQRTSLINFITTIHSTLCVQFTCLTVLFDNFTRSSLVLLVVLDPLLHTPCISSPNHHLFFAAHSHTIAACSAVIPMLCHLYLVSLSSLLGNLSFSLMQHIHPPDHSHLCSLKCHHIFFPYRPGITSMQHTASQTATVQPSSHNQ